MTIGKNFGRMLYLSHRCVYRATENSIDLYGVTFGSSYLFAVLFSEGCDATNRGN